MKRVVLAAALCAAALAVPSLGCARGPAGPGPSNDLLIVGYDREPDTLNRFSTHILEDIQAGVVEGLTITDEKMNVIPLLAAEVPTPENGGVSLRPDGGMDVTWKLRPGVTWHDGTPFTSADVKFTVDAINDPGYNPESTDGFDRIIVGRHARSADRHRPLQRGVRTIRAAVHARGLAASSPQWPGYRSRQRLQSRTARYGALQVAEWKSGEYIRLERVPRLLARFGVPQESNRCSSASSPTPTRGSTSCEAARCTWWPRFRGTSTAKSRPFRGLSSIARPATRTSTSRSTRRRIAAFREVRVRRALMHAVDRELIVQSILDGLAQVTHGPIQPVSWAYTDEVTKYAFDPARARALLDEAGWQAAGNGIRQKDGVPLAFTLITQAGFAVRESVSQVLQRQFRDVGVDMKVQLVDGTSISSLWFEGNFDAMLHWWQMPADPELTLFFAADRVPPHGRNINYFDDAEVTRLVYAADRTVDIDERKRLLRLAQQRIADLVPELPLYSVTKLDAIPAALRGFTGNPTNIGVFWNVHAWELQIGAHWVRLGATGADA